MVIQASIGAGSSYFNYKGAHSIVLMAVSDVHYRLVIYSEVKKKRTREMNFIFIKFRCILVDIGDSGRHSDGGVLSNSDFGQALVNDSLFIPDPCPLTGTTQPKLPYVIAADKAFPLRMNMVRPYPGKKFPGILNITYSNTPFTCWLFH